MRPERAAIAPHRLRVAAVGDVMLGREVGVHFALSPGDFAMPDIRAAFAGADVVLANLENPVASTGRPDPAQDPHVTFRAAPETLSVLKGIGVNVVALGNNHMLDYGEAALIETLERLDAAGIRHVGAGRDYEEANAPVLLEVRGRRIAILSYAFIYSANTRMASRTRSGISDHRLDRILRRIRGLVAEGCCVLVTAHWGFEYRFHPLPYQMRQARAMIDAGARIVLGHGPHIPQGIEAYRGRDIVYSLGNFIFDEPYTYAKRSFIYHAEIDDDGATMNRRMTPVLLPHHVPSLMAHDDAERMRALVEALSRRYGRRSSAFWRDHSTRYLNELGGRVVRNRSLKYLRVPPMGFYRDVGATGILRIVQRAVTVLRPGGTRRESGGSRRRPEGIS
ncbi:MAG TPA: CapA family protein [Candidatus Dormibacteraeota bacterium]|nr:CapA family protein [Candidatus Dormibacteraeota bacterium]